MQTHQRRRNTKLRRRQQTLMVTVFFDSEGLFLLDIMPHGTTSNYDAYVGTLRKLQPRLCRFQSHRQKQDVLPLHDSIRPHTSNKTTVAIRKLGQL